MNFSKLLCLVLVYSQQLGQVLVEGTPECEGNTAGTAVPCNGKKGGALKLKVNGALPTSVTLATWQKGASDITPSNKYTMEGKDLTISTLDVPDDGEYTAKNVSPVEKFQVKVVDCLGGPSTSPGLCQGKPGGIIKLGLKDGTVASIKWKKGEDLISADNSKYPDGVTEATLTIKNLVDDDEAKFTGGTNGDGEHFSVQVADCFGTGTAAGALVECNGKRDKNLKLRISEVTGADSVTWEKVDGTLPEGNVKKGTKDEGLILNTLGPADKGTYKASYDSKIVSFTVNFPDPKPSDSSLTTKKPTTTGGGGGGGGRDNTTDTVVVHNNNSGGGGGSGAGGGSGSVLSYSPALLVTVTLVHLLLQLAA